MKAKVTKNRKKVAFKVTAPPGSEVFVAGTFNDWNPSSHPMRDNPDSGLFKTAMLLPVGRHEYKYIVNGEWLIDADNPHWTPNEIGTLNSVMNVE